MAEKVLSVADTWSRSDERTYRRPLGEHEDAIALLGDFGTPLGREMWAMYTTVAFKCTGVARNSVASVLEETWKQMRYFNPNIATFRDEHDVVYETVDSSSLNVWLKESFRISDLSSDDLIAELKPMKYMTLYYLPRTSQLVLYTAHWRTDGIGVWVVLDSFFELLVGVLAQRTDDIIWGKEIERLSVAIEEAAGLPEFGSTEVIEAAQKASETFQHDDNTVGIKYLGDLSTMPAGTRSAALHFSAAETEAVVAGCKHHGISVTSGVGAAVAAATYMHANAEDCKKHYNSTIKFGLRPYLQEPYRSEGCVFYTSAWCFPVPAGQSWLQNAQAYQTEYKKGYGHLMPAHREYARIFRDLVRAMAETTPDPPPSNVHISSFGILDNLLRHSHGSREQGVEIEATSFFVSTLSRQNTVYVWTWRGELHMVMNYNVAFFNETMAADFLTSVKSVLVDELKIPT